MLSKDIYKELEDVLGSENVTQEPGILDGYAWQPALNLERRAWVNRPVAAVLPKTTEEVQKIIKICRKNKLRFKAHSTGWAAWGGPSREGVVQIDLRRMNRILEIDEKNMYAVVEPYVSCSQLQAEAMKKGLNCHIIGAGPNTSQLASVTSGWGYGWTGLYTSYGGRNPLGVEWVLPDGEVLTLGSPGSGSGWFCGDGPGPSLRGIMRGWGGTQGGLGVFTKCAVKLSSWPNGPKQVRYRGILADGGTDDVPKTHKVYYLFSPSYEKFADLAYQISNSEIGYIHCKGAPGAMFGLLAPRAMKKLLKSPATYGITKAFQHMTLFALAAHTEREFEYQEKVLKKILEETDSFMMDNSPLPFHGMFWWGVHRSIFPAMMFRPGGDFLTSMGSSMVYDACVKQAKVGEPIKRKYIDKGIFFEDLADCTWGGIYEGTSNWGHLEEIGSFNRRATGELVDGRFEYMDEATRTSNENFLGYPLSALGPGFYKIFGPLMNNFHIWQEKIKDTFDPTDTADSAYYIDTRDTKE